jgi:hypothetical protein
LPICTDGLFPSSWQELSGNPQDPDPKLTGKRSTSLLLYQQWKITFQTERNCLSFSCVMVLFFVEVGTFRRFYLEKIVDFKAGEVGLLVLERTGCQFSKHCWRNQNLVVELVKKTRSPPSIFSSEISGLLSETIRFTCHALSGQLPQYRTESPVLDHAEAAGRDGPGQPPWLNWVGGQK